MSDDKMQVGKVELAKVRCAKCGYDDHHTLDCEYPFHQGHKLQQQRDRDWSQIANQVVGSEQAPEPPKLPKRVAVEIGCDVNGRICAARGNDGSMWQLGDRWTRLPDLPQE